VHRNLLQTLVTGRDQLKKKYFRGKGTTRSLGASEKETLFYPGYVSSVSEHTGAPKERI